MVSLLAALIANEEDVPASRNIMTNLRAIIEKQEVEVLWLPQYHCTLQTNDCDSCHGNCEQ